MKIINFLKSIIVLSVILVLISGCGIISGISNPSNGEDLTFSPRDNITRNDIFIDSNNTTATTAETINETTTLPNNSDYGDYGDYGPKPSELVTTETTDSNLKHNSGNETIRLNFVAAGDNIMHLNMLNDAKDRAKDGKVYNFIDMYKDIEYIIKAADISLVNVETPIAGDEFAHSGYPMFNTPKENGFALVDIGFDVICIANNHMLDMKEKGYMNHIAFWESQNVLQIGGFKDTEDFENIRIYEKDGVSIAFLAYTYDTNGMYLPTGSKMVIPVIDINIIARQVKSARILADLVIVVMHWGQEDVFTPNQWQRTLAQTIVDNGADVIIGMHPHVLQETKWADRPDGGKTLITYSIGNMISGMLGTANMVGGFLSFDIVKTKKDGAFETTIENAKVIPVISHYEMINGEKRGFQTYAFEDYTEELAQKHGNIFAGDTDKKFTYKYVKEIIMNNIAPEFLSDFYKD